jgi:hypothetical protein
MRKCWAVRVASENNIEKTAAATEQIDKLE